MTVDYPERLHKHAHDLDANGHDTAGGGSISITDGSTTVDPATDITFDGATVTDDGGGAATVQFSPGGSVDADAVVFDPTATTPVISSTDVQAALEELVDFLDDAHAHDGSEFVGDGAETDFTLGGCPFGRLLSIDIYFDGLIQDSSVTYTTSDDAGDTQVNFTVAPGNGVVILARYSVASNT